MPAIERMDERLDAIETALVAELSTRTIKRDLLTFTDHTDAEIDAGVVTIVSAGEKDYNNGLGMEAKEGAHQVLLIGHLRVAEGTTGKDIEAVELDLAEEIKAFVRTGVADMSLKLNSIQHSRQLDHPYGWLVANIDAGPPRANIY